MTQHYHGLYYTEDADGRGRCAQEQTKRGRKGGREGAESGRQARLRGDGSEDGTDPDVNGKIGKYTTMRILALA